MHTALGTAAVTRPLRAFVLPFIPRAIKKPGRNASPLFFFFRSRVLYPLAAHVSRPGYPADNVLSCPECSERSKRPRMQHHQPFNNRTKPRMAQSMPGACSTILSCTHCARAPGMKATSEWGCCSAAPMTTRILPHPLRKKKFKKEGGGGGECIMGRRTLHSTK